MFKIKYFWWNQKRSSLGEFDFVIICQFLSFAKLFIQNGFFFKYFSYNSKNWLFFLTIVRKYVMNNKFKEILKSLRIENNVTQPQLATAIGVSNGLISLWENGLREPTMSNLIVLLFSWAWRLRWFLHTCIKTFLLTNITLSNFKSFDFKYIIPKKKKQC